MLTPFSRGAIDASARSTFVAPEGSCVTPEGTTTLDSADNGTVLTLSSRRHAFPLHNSVDKDDVASPTSSETESVRVHSHNANYVGSVHWAAVLDSISELKDQYEREEEARMSAASNPVVDNSPGPRLLYEPVQATRADILASMPARAVADRMVALYFNAQNNASIPILHSGCFLEEV